MQSVPITTDVVSSNPVNGDVYPIQHCEKVCQWPATGRWFSPGTLVSTNKSDRHDLTEILLKVVLNTINQIKRILTMHYQQLYPILFAVSKYTHVITHQENRSSFVRVILSLLCFSIHKCTKSHCGGLISWKMSAM